MRKVLLLKLSSMGDVIHTLYAVHEAQQKAPDVIFDWVIEPDYLPLVETLKNVNPIPFALRATRKKTFAFFHTLRLRSKLKKKLHQESYDLAIDAQGLFKSASIFRLLKKRQFLPKHGFGYQYAREPIASFFYTQKHNLSAKALHAIYRTRILFGDALGYRVLENEPITPPLLKIREHALKNAQNQQEKIWFLAHGTAWESKRYPIANWALLAQFIKQQNKTLVLTYQGEEEKYRAETIASPTKSQIISSPSLKALIEFMARSEFVLGGDTGLLHLAAALGVPSIALFGATSSKRSGVLFGENLKTNYPCSPCFSRTCHLDKEDSPCMKTLSPAWVFAQSQALLKEGPSFSSKPKDIILTTETL